jgi:hypothetical protein
MKLTPELIATLAKLMVDGVADRKFFESYIDNKGDKTEVHADLKIAVIKILIHLENEEAAKTGAKPDLHTDKAHCEMMTVQIMSSLPEIVAAICAYVKDPTVITTTIMSADGTEETRIKTIPPPFDRLGWTVKEVVPDFGKIIIKLLPIDYREQIFKTSSKPSFKPKDAVAVAGGGAGGGGGGFARYCKEWQATGTCHFGERCLNKIAHIDKSDDGFTTIAPSKQRKPATKNDCHHFLNLDEEHGGCKHGDKCNYTHDDEWALPQAKIAHTKGKRLCNFFRNPDKCKYGPECHHYHPTTTSMKKMPKREVIEEADDDDDDDDDDDTISTTKSDDKPAPKSKARAGAGAAAPAVLETYATKARARGGGPAIAPKPRGAAAFHSKSSKARKDDE